MPTILCVDDDASVRSSIVRTLEHAGYEALAADGVLQALQVLAQHHVDLIVTDWMMPNLTGLDLLELLRQEGDQTPVVVLTAFGTIEHAVTALQAGAVNYLAKPFAAEQLKLAVMQALGVARLRAENSQLLREAAARRSEHEIVGESGVMVRMMELITAAATSRATVLLQGESGTGKELVARSIHERSERHRGPLVRINCAAMPEGLIESTLFGHERGAFTGAVRQTTGAFERAHGGTLLLDEISEMRLDLQPKLLRVLQEREFERVGGTHTIKCDVRVIATTNRDLASHVAEGRFRQDLFYRLSVFPIVVPALRERGDDVALLAYRFAARAADEARKHFAGLAPDALEALRTHSWPGNVRELQHAIERAVILTTSPTLERHLFNTVMPPARRATDPPAPPDEPNGLRLRTLNLMEVEQEVIARALANAGGNRTRAAMLLGIDVRTLRRKLNDGPHAATSAS